jgi:dTDP-4-amino-4,6-dideoxygalactose transaminase
MHATKPVACGEGAFVLSTDTALIERLRRRSNFGFDPQRNARMTGLNAKMSEYHAAVAHASLDQWPDMRARLVAAGRLYRKRLASAPDITTQQGWAETWISTTLNVRLARPPGLSALIARLAEAGIEARSWWGRGCHAQPAFSACESGPLPVTEDIARRTIGLPFLRELCEADVDRIIGELERATRGL